MGGGGVHGYVLGAGVERDDTPFFFFLFFFFPVSSGEGGFGNRVMWV